MKCYSLLRLGAPLLLLAALPLVARALSPEEIVAAAERAEKGGALQQAVDLYGQFLKENPDHVKRATVLYRLALAFDGLGQVAPTITTLQQVIAIPPDRAADKHRPDAFMRLAKLQADGGKHAEAAATLEQLFKEGAGLYEDEAQNLRAGYLTLMGRFDDAAILFNVLRNKPTSPFAKDAAYKLPIVWIKAAKYDLAKSSIEEFAQRFPENPRVVELFIRLARAHYDQKNFKSAVELCQQVLSEFKESPEAIEAAFVVALSYRDANKLDTAVERLEAVAKMPQAAHNSVLASEALFEAAQICRKSLNQPERAADLYQHAATTARDELTERQQQILEQSLFFAAEYLLKQEKWAAAYDLYAQLRKMGSKLNLLSRILQCQAKMSSDGGASLAFDTEEEINFIRQRIVDNPKTLIALQAELYLLDRQLAKLQYDRQRDQPGAEWSTLKPIWEEYAALLKKYPADILAQQDLSAYIRLRMGSVYTFLRDNDPDKLSRLRSGIRSVEQALDAAPQALFRIEALEILAQLASRADERQKAFAAYQKLFALTGQDPQAKARRPPAEYLQGMVASATTVDLAEEAIKAMQQVIAQSPPQSSETREARFYLAELLYLRQRLSEAAKAYKEFVRLYGPAQDADGKVLPAGAAPAQVDPGLDQVYEAGIRVAQCWRTQGHTANMIEAYRWVIANQNHQNPRVAEAKYTVLLSGVNLASLPPPKKEDMGRELWTQLVNPSLDFGAKAFREGFYPWVRESSAVPFVRVALMKAAQLTAEAGNHRRAAEMYKSFVELYDPGNPGLRGQNGQPLFRQDDLFFMASYAVGREYVLANDPVAMVDAFRGYLDGMRDSTYRAAALQLVGHYGTLAELYNDAADAYAALLDEYAPAGTAAGPYSTPVPPAARLRQQSNWNGLRLPTPEKWDPGQIRFGLGFLYWRKEQWEPCATALQPFLTDPSLRANSSRAEALYMLGRCKLTLGQVAPGQGALERVVQDHPDFKGIEDVYVELVRSHVKAANWEHVQRYCQLYVEKNPTGLRRTYVDLCAALMKIGKGQAEAGERELLALAQSDTYEDVKAEAYYRLGLRKFAAMPSDPVNGVALLRKSVETCPLAPALLELARQAVQQRDWATAGKYLDQLARDFPRADRDVIERAQQLRQLIKKLEADKRR